MHHTRIRVFAFLAALSFSFCLVSGISSPAHAESSLPEFQADEICVPIPPSGPILYLYCFPNFITPAQAAALATVGCQIAAINAEDPYSTFVNSQFCLLAGFGHIQSVATQVANYALSVLRPGICIPYGPIIYCIRPFAPVDDA